MMVARYCPKNDCSASLSRAMKTWSETTDQAVCDCSRAMFIGDRNFAGRPSTSDSGKSRSKRASTAGAAASEAHALDKVTEDAIKSQAREIREALAVNRQKLTSLEQDALQVLAVVEKKGGGKK